MVYPLISKKPAYYYLPLRVSVTEFKDLADIKCPDHSEMKLLPQTARPLQTSLPEWFDKKYTLDF